MSQKREEALAFHAQGYNCAQSVLMAFSDQTGLTPSASAALSAGFGGGAGCRELCGALSGSFMVYGCLLGADQRPTVMALGHELSAAFQKKFGALRCEDLKALRVPCDELIAFCAEHVEKSLSGLSGDRV